MKYVILVMFAAALGIALADSSVDFSLQDGTVVSLTKESDQKGVWYHTRFKLPNGQVKTFWRTPADPKMLPQNAGPITLPEYNGVLTATYDKHNAAVVYTTKSEPMLVISSLETSTLIFPPIRISEEIEFDDKIGRLELSLEDPFHLITSGNPRGVRRFKAASNGMLEEVLSTVPKKENSASSLQSKAANGLISTAEEHPHMEDSNKFATPQETQGIESGNAVWVSRASFILIVISGLVWWRCSKS